MRHTITVSLAAALLLTTMHRLPAPIVEPTPAASAEKPHAAPAKRKSSEATDFNSTRRFDGTWKGTGTTNGTGFTSTYTVILIIKDGKAVDTTTEVTANLLAPRGLDRVFRRD